MEYEVFEEPYTVNKSESYDEVPFGNEPSADNPCEETPFTEEHSEDFPTTENPSSGNPTMDNPIMELPYEGIPSEDNPRENNIKINKTEKENNIFKRDRFVGCAYTIEELNQLIEVSKGTVLELPILLAGFYGFRRSEICGLDGVR